MQHRTIFSARRTLAVEIKPEGLLVRAPYGTSEATIELFLRENKRWIEEHMKKAEKRSAALAGIEKLTSAELKALAERAKQVIPERVRLYAAKLGVTYGRITIRNQKSKWGSCSAAGNLNFNCLLMLAPPEVVDSVVVHELCHRKEMNHSERFYAEVYKVFPEYKKWNGWLKKHAAELMARNPNA